MGSFLEKIHPFLVSDDKIVQDFVLLLLNGSHLATDETFEMALKAMDKDKKDPLRNRFLPRLREYPMSEKNFSEVLRRYKKQDDNMHWYALLLSSSPTDLLAKYRGELYEYFENDALDNIIRIPSLETEIIFSEFQEIVETLEGEKYINDSLFRFGIRLLTELLKRNEIEKEDVIELIHFQMTQENFTYLGIFYVYLAGELKISELVETLASLLTREHDEILTREAADALVKIGGENVVNEVAPYVLEPAAAMIAIDILSKVKCQAAEQALLRLFDEVQNVSLKTLIANSLCQQLTVEGISKVEDLIETGYDTKILELEESAYGCCVINGIDHPKLASWKAHTENMDDIVEQIIQEQNLVTTNKVGRNDPCPCGSGKKYKKCCGK